MILPLQGANFSCTALPKALPWASRFCPVRASCANSYTIVLSWEYSFGICAYRRLTTIKVEDATKRAFYFVILQNN